MEILPVIQVIDNTPHSQNPIVHPQQDTKLYLQWDRSCKSNQTEDLKPRSMTALTSCVKQSWKYTIMDKVIRNGTDPQTLV